MMHLLERFAKKQFRNKSRTIATTGWRPLGRRRFKQAQPELWTLITDCWKDGKMDRPTFIEIAQRLRDDIPKVVGVVGADEKTEESGDVSEEACEILPAG